MDNTKLIYIMGRGHSGSTLLDVVLGNSKDIESVGELVSAMSRIEKEICSCKEKMTRCPYWTSILSNFNNKYSDKSFKSLCFQSVKQGNIKIFFKTLFFKRKYVKLVDGSFDFFKEVSLISKKKFIVDSSKEHTRGLLFSRSDRAHLIHIVRRPDRILSSTYFRAINGEQVKFLRFKFQPKNKIALFLYILTMSVSWSIGNFLAEITKLVARNKVLLIRYEDFITQPKDTLIKIQNQFKIDLSDLIYKLEQKELLYIGHNVGGNRFRFQESFTIEPQKSTQRKLPSFFKGMTILINLPFMLYYGYNPFN